MSQLSKSVTPNSVRQRAEDLSGVDLVSRLRGFLIATDPAFPVHPAICEEAANEIEWLLAWIRRVSCHDFFRHEEDFASRSLEKLTNEAKLILRETGVE